MDKKSFYGHGTKRKQATDIKVKLQRREKYLKIESIPASYPKRIVQPCSLWKVFHRQQDAFSYARSTSEDLHVIAYESPQFWEQHGQRMFLVTSYDQFWHYYSQLESSQRHHYEVISEGSACHLYFDLEFDKVINPEADGPQMTQTFIKYVLHALKCEFRLQCDVANVLQLDASTEKKFSCHLILKLPGAAFKDNINAGSFVRQVCETLSSMKEVKSQESSTILSLEEVQSLFVKNKNQEDILFCDQGVYTKNRTFRFFLSCKYGKDNPLLLASYNSYQTDSIPGGSQEKQLFMESIVTNVRFSSCLRILTFGSFEERSNKGQNGSKLIGGSTNAACEGFVAQSPYPEVDQFILNNALSAGGVQGFIRRWVYFSQGETIVYDVGKNRWCANIGRAHKSNNILIIADLKRACYYQKCHDPECKASDFKSPEHALPTDVLPAACFQEADDFEDDDLIVAMNEYEMNEFEMKMNGYERKMYSEDDDITDEQLLEAVCNTEALLGS